MLGKLKKKMLGRTETASTGSTPVPPQQHHDESNARPGTAEATMQPTLASALPEGNLAVDVGKSAALAEQEKGVAEMKDMLTNLEKNKNLLRAEDIKLQRIEDELKAANINLVKNKDGRDAKRKRSAVADVSRLRGEKTTCDDNLKMYSELINALQDQIVAAERVRIVEEFTQASGLTVDANGKVELSGSPASEQRKGSPSVDLEKVVLAEQEKRVAEKKDKLANMEENRKLLRDEDLKLQRIEDELKVANSELLKIKDRTDATEKNRVIANVKRIRDARTTCRDNQSMYSEFIHALQDQIAAAERVGSLH
jgi:hypothetical protein